MGKFEKIFWLVIAIFALIWLGLQLLAYQHISHTKQQHNKPILTTSIKTIIEIVDDNETIKNNLENNTTMHFLKENLAQNIHDMQHQADHQIELAFSPVYQNIDAFLDFHYSVIGEYTELGAAATGKIAETIKEKLFGREFDRYLNKAQQNINKTYIQNLQAHIEQIHIKATGDIDKTLNAKILQDLNADITQRFTQQKIKLGAFVGTAAAIKIISIISAKIAAKAASKIAVKTASKSTAKVASAGTAAAAGTLCGPFAWICSPLAATAAWFGTDALIITGDEYLNREDFKHEIIMMIDAQKAILKKRIKALYTQKFQSAAMHIQRRYKSTNLKKKVKRTIKEKIFQNNLL